MKQKFYLVALIFLLSFFVKKINAQEIFIAPSWYGIYKSDKILYDEHNEPYGFYQLKITQDSIVYSLNLEGKGPTVSNHLSLEDFSYLCKALKENENKIRINLRSILNTKDDSAYTGQTIWIVRSIGKYYMYGYRDLLFARSNTEKIEFHKEKDYSNKNNITPSNVAQYNEQAYQLQQQGKNKEAAEILEKIIQVAPTRVVAYLNLADAYWGLSKTAEAKTNYQKYIDIMKAQKKDLSRIPKRVYERVK